jgi:hypothetical protein
MRADTAQGLGSQSTLSNAENIFSYEGRIALTTHRNQWLGDVLLPCVAAKRNGVDYEEE